MHLIPSRSRSLSPLFRAVERDAHKTRGKKNLIMKPKGPLQELTNRYELRSIIFGPNEFLFLSRQQIRIR
jgi:hypothetical protein